MKVIDLLNKVANENFLPKAVNSKTRSISYYLYEKCCSECDDRNLQDILNADLEILEEKKIPEKIDNEYFERAGSTYKDRLCKDKINEIIDYLHSKGDE